MPSALENFVKNFGKEKGQEKSPEVFTKEVVEQIVREVMDEFPKHGWVPVLDVNDLYRSQQGELIVRRESPQRLMDAVLNDHDLNLSFENVPSDQKYLNSAIWSTMRPETMRWAMQEGMNMTGGLSVVEVIDPTVSDIQVESIENAIPTIVMPSGETIDRSTYRATSGTVRPEDLRFIVVATVAQRFPIDQMTQDEKDRFDEWQDEMAEFQEAKKSGQRMKQPDPFNIVRAFVPPKNSAKQQTFQQAA